MANPAWKKTAEKMVPKGTVPNPSKPSTALTLEWVHGYRGFDCRNNVRYVTHSGSQVAFTAAALSIVQDTTSAVESSSASQQRQQNYFGEHGDDIISTAVYEPSSTSSWTQVLMATGEIGKSPAIHLYVWKPSNTGKGGQFQSLACMRGLHLKGVCQLAFSTKGDRLFSVGVEYTIAVYNTEQGSPQFGKMVGSSQGPKDKVLHASVCGPTGDDFFTCGEKHVCLWKMQNNTPKSETGKLGEHKNKSFMSAARGKGGIAVVGTSEGDLLLFRGTELLKSGNGKPVHDKAVNAVWSNPTGEIVLSGGRDGNVIVWACDGESLTKLQSFLIFGYSQGVELPTPAPPPPIRSVCLSPDGRRIAVGTQTCEIVEFTKESNVPFVENPTDTNIKAFSIVVGHFKDELWGLAVRPSLDGGPETEFCTVGDDGFLRIWNIAEHKQLRCRDMQGMARCCAYSPDGQYIAVGFGGSVGKGKNKEDGLVRIYRSDDKLGMMTEVKEAKQWISCIKYSPDGATLGVGSRDNRFEFIYIFFINFNLSHFIPDVSFSFQYFSIQLKLF